MKCPYDISKKWGNTKAITLNTEYYKGDCWDSSFTIPQFTSFIYYKKEMRNEHGQLMYVLCEGRVCIKADEYIRFPMDYIEDEMLGPQLECDEIDKTD